MVCTVLEDLLRLLRELQGTAHLFVGRGRGRECGYEIISAWLGDTLSSLGSHPSELGKAGEDPLVCECLPGDLCFFW